jgi:drug/metabolite transporter (DMT)-like permease
MRLTSAIRHHDLAHRRATILLRGDSRLVSIFSTGGVMFAARSEFGLYSALIRGGQTTAVMISFTIGCGAPANAILDLEFRRRQAEADALTAALIYVMSFPDAGLSVLQPRHALIRTEPRLPFLHLVPVFGSAMAILLLGEQPQLFHLTGYVLVLAGVVIASRRASASA